MMIEIPKYNGRGVYILKNLTNGKNYIGSSDNIERRIYDHLNSLNRGSHYSEPMQKDFNNGDNFICAILKKFPNRDFKDELYHFERIYIIQFDSINNGYNTLLPNNYYKSYEQHIDEEKQIKRQRENMKKFKSRENSRNQYYKRRYGVTVWEWDSMKKNKKDKLIKQTKMRY